MSQSTPGPDQPAPPPEIVGAYRIERELGAGGMGTVYLGRHVETGAEAAVKVLPASMAREPGFVARFNREILAMQKLKSPGIVELYDSGEQDGTWYYAMEYVPGETLTERLHRERRLPWRDAVDIGVQVCRALKAAHNCGIIHRDLKPSNLLLHENGTVKLTDFGIAQVFASSKLTVTGGILGTAEFMSPEQAQGKRVTKQSDLYSLGAVLYVMITGRPPFTGKSTLEIAQKHRFSQFDSPKRIVPEIPFWLDEIICKCLAKKVEDRYPDAYVLGLRLQEVIGKVDLKNSEKLEFDDADSSSATIAEGDAALPGNGPIGGTMARDLFRAHLESEEQTTVWSRLTDNIWVLVATLLLLIFGGIGLVRWNRADPQEMFLRGESLMKRPEGPAWETALRDYFTPLLEQDEEHWRPQIDPYLRQIEIYQMKKDLLGRGGRRVAQPGSEGEAILRQAVELSRVGRTGEAVARLAALEVLLADQEEQQQIRELAGSLKEEIRESSAADRQQLVIKALQRAERLQAAGKTAEAVPIWRSLLELYHADPDLQEWTSEAQRQLDSALSESTPSESTSSAMP